MFRVKDLLLAPETFDDPIFRNHLCGFRLYGYVASTDQKRPWFSLVRCIFFTVSLWMCCALMLARVFRGYENLNDGATSWATAVQYFAMSIATLNAIVQRDRVIGLLRVAHADIQNLISEADDREMELLAATQVYTRNITLTLCGPSFIAGSMAYLDCIYRTVFLPKSVFNSSAVQRGEEQPILMFQLFPLKEVCDNFVVGYIGAWYALSLGMTAIPMWHTFITCLMKYVNLRLQILNKRVEEMDITRLNPRLIIDRLSPTELSHWRKQLFRDFVEEHIRIRNLVHEIQHLIRVPVMLDFIIFSISMCFLFYALALGISSKMDYFFIGIYIFVMAAILWMYHWHATLIVECNDKLSFAYFSCGWYNFDVPLQRTLLFVMMHAQRPMNMRALLVELNLRTFIDIMRGAYSYFNLLRSSH
ncbi:odorant receptor 56a isoform X1 [Drosophila elegans]|uniref:odorant receptor 56a isoform X1 n=2 Tax=Drosophila elegans TaxID=30023 RepID=UPI0007E5D05C|nr:odorant receptor 56a isoform X1 [Drosophila elegans]